jgi:iron complex transport system substrate-binding protein
MRRHLIVWALGASLIASVGASEERLITAGGGITEIVYALGMGNRVVGVDSSSVFPDEATHLPQVGYARMLSPEGLLSLRPTKLITSDEAGPESALAQLETSGVCISKLETKYDVDATVQRIEEIAEILGDEEKAKPVVSALRADIEKAHVLVANAKSKPKVLFIYARSGGILNVSGTDTAASAMIELAGGSNAVTGYAGYKPLTAEAAVSVAPDVILVTTRGLAEAGGIAGLLSHPGLALTPAGKNRRVVAMEDLYLLGFGPRLGRAVQDLCIALHSDNTPVATSLR